MQQRTLVLLTQDLESDLRNVCLECRKRHPSVKEMGEKCMMTLTNFRDKLSKTTEGTRTPPFPIEDVIKCVLMACETQQPKAVILSLNIIQKLINWRLVGSGLVAIVVNLMKETAIGLADKDEQVQLKVLQTALLLLTPGADEVVCSDQVLEQVLQLFGILHDAPSPAVHNTAIAGLRQLAGHIMDSVATAFEREKESLLQTLGSPRLEEVSPMVYRDETGVQILDPLGEGEGGEEGSFRLQALLHGQSLSAPLPPAFQTALRFLLDLCACASLGLGFTGEGEGDAGGRVGLGEGGRRGSGSGEGDNGEIGSSSSSASASAGSFARTVSASPRLDSAGSREKDKERESGGGVGGLSLGLGLPIGLSLRSSASVRAEKELKEKERDRERERERDRETAGRFLLFGKVRLPAAVCIEMLHASLSARPEFFLQVPSFFVLLKQHVPVLVVRGTRAPLDFPCLIRLLRLVKTLLSPDLFLPHLVPELCVILPLLLRLTDAERPVWMRAAVLELFRSVCGDSALLVGVFRRFDLSPSEALGGGRAAADRERARAVEDPFGPLAPPPVSLSAGHAGASSGLPSGNSRGSGSGITGGGGRHRERERERERAHRVFEEVIEHVGKVIHQTTFTMDRESNPFSLALTPSTAAALDAATGHQRMVRTGSSGKGGSSGAGLSKTSGGTSGASGDSRVARLLETFHESGSPPELSANAPVLLAVEALFALIGSLHSVLTEATLERERLAEAEAEKGAPTSGSGDASSSSSASAAGEGRRQVPPESSSGGPPSPSPPPSTVGESAASTCAATVAGKKESTPVLPGGEGKKGVVGSEGEPLATFAEEPLSEGQLIVRQMVSAAWPSVLSALSLLLSASADELSVVQVLKAYETLLFVAGSLSIDQTREAALLAITRLAMPQSPDSVFERLDSALNPGSEYPHALTTGGVGSAGGGGEGALGSVEAWKTKDRKLDSKSLRCLKALLSICSTLGGVLGVRGWLVVLPALEELERILSGSTKAKLAGLPRGGSGSGGVVQRVAGAVSSATSASTGAPPSSLAISSSLAQHPVLTAKLTVLAAALEAVFKTSRRMAPTGLRDLVTALGTRALTALEGDDSRAAVAAQGSGGAGGSGPSISDGGGAGPSGSSLDSGGGTRLRNFGLQRLVDVAVLNVDRIDILWQCVLAHLICVCNSRAASREVREEGVVALVQVLRASVPFYADRPSIQTAMLSPLTDLVASPVADVRTKVLDGLHDLLQSSGQALSRKGWVLVLVVLGRSAAAEFGAPFEALVNLLKELEKGGEVSSQGGVGGQSLRLSDIAGSFEFELEGQDREGEGGQHRGDGRERGSILQGGAGAGGRSRGQTQQQQQQGGRGGDKSRAALFRVVELLVQEFPERLPRQGCLKVLVTTAAAFGRSPSLGINTSFRAVGYLWNIADALGRGKGGTGGQAEGEEESGAGTPAGIASKGGASHLTVGGVSFSVDCFGTCREIVTPTLDAKKEKESEEEDTLASLWLAIFLHLRVLTLDPRAEVRNCAARSLVTAVLSHGRRWSRALWRRIVRDILVSTLEEVAAERLRAFANAAAGTDSLQGSGVEQSSASQHSGSSSSSGSGGDGMIVHHSRDSGAKQWDETLVIAVDGLARVVCRFSAAGKPSEASEGVSANSGVTAEDLAPCAYALLRVCAGCLLGSGGGVGRQALEVACASLRVLGDLIKCEVATRPLPRPSDQAPLVLHPAVSVERGGAEGGKGKGTVKARHFTLRGCGWSIFWGLSKKVASVSAASGSSTSDKDAGQRGVQGGANLLAASADLPIHEKFVETLVATLQTVLATPAGGQRLQPSEAPLSPPLPSSDVSGHSKLNDSARRDDGGVPGNDPLHVLIAAHLLIAVSTAPQFVLLTGVPILCNIVHQHTPATAHTPAPGERGRQTETETDMDSHEGRARVAQAAGEAAGDPLVTRLYDELSGALRDVNLCTRLLTISAGDGGEKEPLCWDESPHSASSTAFVGISGDGDERASIEAEVRFAVDRLPALWSQEGRRKGVLVSRDRDGDKQGTHVSPSPLQYAKEPMKPKSLVDRNPEWRKRPASGSGAFPPPLPGPLRAAAGVPLADAMKKVSSFSQPGQSQMREGGTAGVAKGEAAIGEGGGRTVSASEVLGAGGGGLGPEGAASAGGEKLNPLFVLSCRLPFPLPAVFECLDGLPDCLPEHPQVLASLLKMLCSVFLEPAAATADTLRLACSGRVVGSLLKCTRRVIQQYLWADTGSPLRLSIPDAIASSSGRRDRGGQGVDGLETETGALSNPVSPSPVSAAAVSAPGDLVGGGSGRHKERRTQQQERERQYGGFGGLPSVSYGTTLPQGPLPTSPYAAQPPSQVARQETGGVGVSSEGGVGAVRSPTSPYTDGAVETGRDADAQTSASHREPLETHTASNPSAVVVAPSPADAVAAPQRPGMVDVLIACVPFMLHVLIRLSRTKRAPALALVGLWKVAAEAACVLIRDTVSAFDSPQFGGVRRLFSKETEIRFWWGVAIGCVELAEDDCLSAKRSAVSAGRQDVVSAVREGEALELMLRDLAVGKLVGMPDCPPFVFPHLVRVLDQFTRPAVSADRPELARDALGRMFELCTLAQKRGERGAPSRSSERDRGDRPGSGQGREASSQGAHTQQQPAGGGAVPLWPESARLCMLSCVTPVLMRRVQQILSGFIRDDTQSGQCPLPRHRLDEVAFVFSELRRLDLPPEVYSSLASSSIEGGGGGSGGEREAGAKRAPVTLPVGGPGGDVGSLSGSERAELARTLAGRKCHLMVLLPQLSECIGSKDPHVRRELQRLFSELSKSLGLC
uniref:Protein MON2 homolog n=1 Tax=Chromera velia CCMP2878 TaxID=1169474 RepID=A0A0G4FBH3_9ALVE|eukprot:Cvel_3038.t1-p1 / transcript=Cvel_3038.t1 / gene=Cvel_3038 / organism=Chromera_velia_CCMP2878 / gene_product=Protein MON2 homolog, putative / transcript_product=Protein MON2 homolog, putative / location=Cvel_scaffold121:77062-90147(-) / protein_length=2810 / sequence_SO=supercontig / SO=protein_coding / is_pseudo=false